MADGSYTIPEYVAKWGEVKERSRQLEGPSLADRLAMVEKAEPGFTGELLDRLGPAGCTMLAFDRAFWLRPKQLAPFGKLGAWRILLFLAGRRNGKTLTAAEWIVSRLEAGAREIVIVGPNYDDVRSFMLGGHKRRIDGANGSGVLDVIPPWIRYVVKEDEGIVEFPDHKAVLRMHSAEVPEFRGPGPDSVWGDEPIKWRYPEKLISNLELACSDGGAIEPQIVFTCSPKKLKFLRDLVMRDDVVTIHARNRENRGNVAESWYLSQEKRLRGTKQGAEEMDGELGVEDEGALFSMTKIDANRVDAAPPLERIVVPIDPAGSKHRTSDETGLTAVGRAGDIHSGHGYVLADRSKKYSWEGWGLAAWELLLELGASAFVLERNKFADAVAANIRTSGEKFGFEVQPRPGTKHLLDMVNVDLVVRDKDGKELRRDKGKGSGRRVQIVEVLAMGDKATRAGPVSTMCENDRMHFVGHLADAESEISEWDPTSGISPGRLDSIVHGFVELFALDRPPEEDARKQVAGLPAANERLNELAATRRAQGRSMGHYRNRLA